MSGKLSPRARMKMAKLQTMADKVQHVHGMVEKYASTRSDQHAQILVLPLKRALGQLKLDLLGAGFEAMSQLAGSMEVAAGRGTRRQRTRILREGVGSLRFQVEHEQQKVVSEEKAAQRRAEKEQERAEQEQGEPTCRYVGYGALASPTGD